MNWNQIKTDRSRMFMVNDIAWITIRTNVFCLLYLQQFGQQRQNGRNYPQKTRNVYLENVADVDYSSTIIIDANMLLLSDYEGEYHTIYTVYMDKSDTDSDITYQQSSMTSVVQLPDDVNEGIGAIDSTYRFDKIDLVVKDFSFDEVKLTLPEVEQVEVKELNKLLTQYIAEDNRTKFAR